MRAPSSLDFGAGEKRGERFDRIQRRRKTDPHRARRPAPPHHPFEALQRERQMSAALVAGDRVELVNDDVADGRELLAKARRGQQDEQRLGRGDEDVRRPPQHRGAFARGVSPVRSPARIGASSRPISLRLVAHTGQRLLEIEADVIGQRL